MKNLYYKRIKCNKCGFEQNIALSDTIKEFKTLETIECRKCKSINKTEIPMLVEKNTSGWDKVL